MHIHSRQQYSSITLQYCLFLKSKETSVIKRDELRQVLTFMTMKTLKLKAKEFERLEN